MARKVSNTLNWDQDPGLLCYQLKKFKNSLEENNFLKKKKSFFKTKRKYRQQKKCLVIN